MSNITASLPSLDILSILSSPALASVSASAQSTSWKAYAASLGLGYLVLCQALRFRREKAMRKKYGYPDRESLKTMTVEHAQMILKDLATLEFPQFMETSLQFALFKVGNGRHPCETERAG
jgi:outer membrane receptor for monomeric catechols